MYNFGMLEYLLQTTEGIVFHIEIYIYRIVL